MTAACIKLNSADGLYLKKILSIHITAKTSLACPTSVRCESERENWTDNREAIVAPFLLATMTGNDLSVKFYQISYLWSTGDIAPSCPCQNRQQGLRIIANLTPKPSQF